MLQSKKGNLILALILAIALWAYVVGEKNPDVSREDGSRAGEGVLLAPQQRVESDGHVVPNRFT